MTLHNWIKLGWQANKSTWLNMNHVQRIDYTPSKFLRIKLTTGESMSLTNNQTTEENLYTEYQRLDSIITTPKEPTPAKK